MDNSFAYHRVIPFSFSVAKVYIPALVNAGRVGLPRHVHFFHVHAEMKMDKRGREGKGKEVMKERRTPDGFESISS